MFNIQSTLSDKCLICCEWSRFIFILSDSEIKRSNLFLCLLRDWYVILFYTFLSLLLSSQNHHNSFSYRKVSAALVLVCHWKELTLGSASLTSEGVRGEGKRKPKPTKPNNNHIHRPPHTDTDPIKKPPSTTNQSFPEGGDLSCERFCSRMQTVKLLFRRFKFLWFGNELQDLSLPA